MEEQKKNELVKALEEQNKKLNLYAEQLKNAYADLEAKVNFRNLELEKMAKELREENARLKSSKA